MIWTMLILLPQTWILLVRKLCCMCLKTTNQWSRWFFKRKSPTMRHVSRTHRVALDWLFDMETIYTPKIQIKYIDTKKQLADILTKRKFTCDEWNHLLCLFNISHFSSANRSEVISKRTQKDSGERRVTAKSKPMMNLVSRCSEKTLDVRVLLLHQKTPVKTRFESQLTSELVDSAASQNGDYVKDA